MRVAIGMIVNIHEGDMVGGEILGEREFGVFLEEIDKNFQICGILYNFKHCLVRWH